MTPSSAGTRRAILLAPATVLALLLSGPAYAGGSNAGTRTAPPRERITVEVVTVNGSGCPAGTADVSVNPDNTGFRVTYDDFSAQAGGGNPPTETRKNCQVNIRFKVPNGYVFAIAKADYRGTARLADGATGLQRSNYYFQGSAQNDYVDHTFAGPLYDDWHTTDIGPLVFSPCNKHRNLNINTELRVNVGTSDKWRTSSLTMDSSGGKIFTLFEFAWREC
jgi:hypothetical protein